MTWSGLDWTGQLAVSQCMVSDHSGEVLRAVDEVNKSQKVYCSDASDTWLKIDNHTSSQS